MFNEFLTQSNELETTSTELSDTRTEVERLTAALDQEASTSRFLREDLTATKARAGGLQRRAEALEAELAAARRGEDGWREMDGLYRQVGRELARCLAEIKSLSDVAGQVMSGQDPNMSALLGLGDMLQLTERTAAAAASSEEEPATRSEAIRSQVPRSCL